MSTVVLDRRIRSGLDQQLGHLLKAKDGRGLQGRGKLVVLRVVLRARRQQALDHVDVLAKGGSGVPASTSV